MGKDITGFEPGEAVFGGRQGTLAEYVVAAAGRLAKKPDNVSFEQAGAVYIAARTALQALRDAGKLEPGQKVLINGASGGVGTFAVQIAKHLGAEATGVSSCSPSFCGAAEGSTMRACPRMRILQQAAPRPDRSPRERRRAGC